ncbi:NAD(P)/FAD-dependent oxidoreductase [Pseudoruegeria sp. HB172150]|uniref:FAD-dependent oxidoreductase n=1 Tax=Pseudoruegeria sp. HB172150 TaxID=2721164 RepID=UPI0020A69806|nr:NAD(P)/FAD-dependent oxidoreductase [Pseudoruegeria sp. HB172150]
MPSRKGKGRYMVQDIAVAGAGIGGLAFATLAAREGRRVTVFDQFDAPRPIGSGLVIQPVGQMVLDVAGAGDSARALGQKIHSMLGHEATTGRRVLDVTYDRKGGPHYGLGIHRAALFDCLLTAARDTGAEIRPDHRVSARDGQRLIFANGTSDGPFELIVDAAGAASPLSPLQSRPLGYGAVWGTVPWPDTRLPTDRLSQRYRAADRMIGALPIGRLPDDQQPLAAIFWSLPADGHDAWRAAPLDHWKAEATALWPDFAPFLETVTEHDVMTMARYTHGTLRTPVSEGLAHIGDAAHRASPQLGQGANMALLDAYALWSALDRHPLDEALRAYVLARRWHVWTYQVFSAVFTPQYQSDSRFLPKLRDHILFPVSRIPPVPGILSRLVRGTLLPPLGSLHPRQP